MVGTTPGFLKIPMFGGKKIAGVCRTHRDGLFCKWYKMPVKKNAVINGTSVFKMQPALGTSHDAVFGGTSRNEMLTITKKGEFSLVSIQTMVIKGRTSLLTKICTGGVARGE